MKKNKYIIIALVCILSLPFLYKYYLYYKIPYNPLVKISSDVMSCSGIQYENPPQDVISYISTHSQDCSVIFNYLSDLKLKPLKYEDYSTSFDIVKVDYRYFLSFTQPDLYYDLSISAWDKDLSIIYISSNKPGFKEGYYKVTDSEFEYKYINELLSLQMKD